ncbi:hypothetical protein ACMYSP_00605 [Klebsiella sp. R390]
MPPQRLVICSSICRRWRDNILRPTPRWRCADRAKYRTIL